MTNLENLLHVWSREWAEHEGTTLDWVDHTGEKLAISIQNTWWPASVVLDPKKHKLNLVNAVLQKIELK